LIEVMPHVLVTPVLDRSVRGLCVRPYEGHPHGCPNHGRSPRCPPAAPHLFEAFDESGPFYAVYSRFPLGDHVRAMRQRHPGWSDRQLRCVLYWQNSARKKLRAEVALFKEAHPEVDWRVEETPEAMGLDVTATLREVGIGLEWPPAEVATHVALAGRRP
jgi:predicted metal-binding protein